jgi:Protein of unknown function (DUF3604)
MNKYLKISAGVVGGLLLLVGGYAGAFKFGAFGTPPQAGKIEGKAVPVKVIANRAEKIKQAASEMNEKENQQILFGDLHVHTTYSTDAFIWSLPMNGGTGPHPIADACDFARYCSALDFWAITDHAESLTPRRWRETKSSMRTCQEISGGGENPDLISFTGFEWTQVGVIPEEHFGHKNVIFKTLDDASIAQRPVAAKGLPLKALRDNQVAFPPGVTLIEGTDFKRYANFNAFVEEVAGVDMCDPNVPSSKLSPECTEVAATPDVLLRKMDEQGLDPLYIPHGTTWGFYTPTGTTWHKALSSKMRPEDFKLIEVYSGHGNSEEFRDVKTPIRTRVSETEFVGKCVPPTGNFTPSCWRAGEIIRARCEKTGADVQECDIRAKKARNDYIQIGNAGHKSVPGVVPADWLDSGQCKDCFLPTFNQRYGTSVQAGLAAQNFDENPEKPNRSVWGFISSSDNHRARPGTGYKEYQRLLSTESGGPRNKGWKDRFLGEVGEALPHSKSIDPNELLKKVNLNLLEIERNNSFFTTGGLAAVHTKGRTRDEVWQAMQRRETYATSGPRILLWFKLNNAGANGAEEKPMGAEVTMARSPEFSVRAVGAFKQAAGLPDHAKGGISLDRLQKICGGEAYNPTDERHIIDRIEIIRIRPQTSPDQKIIDRIDDPFTVKKCDGNPQGCSFDFSDPDYAGGKSDAIYYARAIQEASPTVNAANLRCEYDAEGQCVKVNPCVGDYTTDASDNCLAPAEHRAWSSPIYLRR